ncbi:TetR family transcriptional regulator [Nitratireductor sp. CAU 1489]|uniref:TetR family transcriptional regulator n=1 Tax=Nitratireductor arenosus TaxID=2682096 RepID=A0A844QFR9_9HYPH|nr:TetR/AcrR family transcriptional regulator [Nitratireductor arenosus]MVA98202.1 TetR family transcriptional regulator [Nitratireductor arenosus]
MTRPASARPPDDATSTSRSAQKRRAILDAATEVFLKCGYPGASMDEIAAMSSVSKQTVYKHFESKEALFVDIVTGMTDAAGDMVHDRTPVFDGDDGLAAYLQDYAHRQLTVVLTPRIMQLRRLVIAEVSRFPDLARVLYQRGPARALAELAALFERLAARGLLTLDDPAMAASHFNWLVMSEPLNRAMLLGDAAIPGRQELRRYAVEGVRVFLAAYGTDRRG